MRVLCRWFDSLGRSRGLFGAHHVSQMADVGGMQGIAIGQNGDMGMCVRERVGELSSGGMPTLVETT